MVCITNNQKAHTQDLKPANLEIGGSRFKSFNEGSQGTEIEDGEFDMTLRKEESLNRDNCTWLSTSGVSSPSSCCVDNGLSGYMDLKIDAWFISLLSTPSSKSSDPFLSTKVAFFDGSRVNPIDEASLVLLDQRKKSDENVVFEENLEEEEVVLWLKNQSSDDVSECYNHTMDKRSKSRFWSKSKLAYFTDSSDEQQSLFSSSSSSDYSSEVLDLEEISTDKPLFWPLNSASDWSSETEWDYFTMSPKKDIYKVHKSSKTAYSLCSEVSDSEKGCNRSLMFGTHLQPSDISDLKNEADNVAFEETRIRTTPVFWPASCSSEWDVDAKQDFLTISPQKDVCYKFGGYGNMGLEKGCSRRLEFSRSSKSSSETTKSTNVVAAEEAEVDLLTTRPVRKHKIVLEDLLLVEKLTAEGVIEQVLGLGEFDGNEGIQSEYKKDEFSQLF